jgi:hypothetical protein
VKPGATTESAEVEEVDYQKLMDIEDEQPKDGGWKVSGTVQNQQGYIKPAFIQQIVQVEFDMISNSNRMILFLVE